MGLNLVDHCKTAETQASTELPAKASILFRLFDNNVKINKEWW